ncbi:MAG: hypothetical protein ACAH21_13565 [Ramlibacter sp.]|nr:hypothetical protein [Ramlibacter sp.]
MEHALDTAAADMAALSRACAALWTANLSLMTAFMQVQAPAHRYLMARKVARNFNTLADQPCFSAASRESFARLAGRWTVKADRLSPHEVRPRKGPGLLARLLGAP